MSYYIKYWLQDTVASADMSCLIYICHDWIGVGGIITCNKADEISQLFHRFSSYVAYGCAYQKTAGYIVVIKSDHMLIAKTHTKPTILCTVNI